MTSNPRRTLMVTPYPPARDGIAAYAVQAVAGLRATGDDVEVLSPGPSAAHHHLDLASWRGPLALARRMRHYDKVVIQYHPDLFYPQPCRPLRHTWTSLALAGAFRAAPELEVRVHETDYSAGAGIRPSSLATRLLWRTAGAVVMHTEAERQSFHRAFGVPLSEIQLAEHGAHFSARSTLDRPAARERLGLPQEGFRFLSIGFIQPHKGFDRAIRAFSGLGDLGCHIDVVGSVRVDEPAYLDHLDDLMALAEATPGAAVRAGYLTDEEFDIWLVASDVVVLPYRHIWSSSVLERAALYQRPVIASRVGGLTSQVRSDSVLVDTDAELARAMREAPGRSGFGSPSNGSGPASSSTVHAPWPPSSDIDRNSVMAEIRNRATARRGGRPVLPTGRIPSTLSAATAASARLRRIPPLAPPAAISARPGTSVLKRLVRRLTAWQIDPLVEQLNRLSRATVDAVEEIAARSGDDKER